MAPGGTNLIDGFSSIQAVRHAQQKRGKTPEVRPEKAKPPTDQPKKSDESPSAKRIGSTAMPSRRTVICYECSYRQTVTGALHNSFCPRCRTKLETGDKVIKGDWQDDVKTIGTVEIHTGAVLGEIEVVGDLIRVAGDVRKADLKATSVIELFDGAKLDVERLETDILRVVAGNRMKLSQPLECRNLEIEGALEGDVRASRTVSILAGGVLDGTLSSPGLTVEEGGGLRAEVRIRPDEVERQ